MKREHQINLWYAILGIVTVIAIGDVFAAQSQIRTIPYSEFQRLAAEGKVADLTVGPSRIAGTLRDAPEGQPRHFPRVRVDPAIAQSLAASGASFSSKPEPGLLAGMIGWRLPMLGFGLIWLFLIRRRTGGQGGLMAIGKSRKSLRGEGHQDHFRRDGGPRSGVARRGFSGRVRSSREPRLVAADGVRRRAHCAVIGTICNHPRKGGSRA